jgi:exopolysaccharide biosynthesis polyprenyl glycosylphosphotransferase
MPLRRRILGIALRLGDLAIMSVAFVIASGFVSDGLSLVRFLTIRIRIANFAIFIALIFLWQLIFSLHGMYRSARLSSPWDRTRRALQAVTWGTLAVLNVTFLFHVRLVTPRFAAVFWLAAAGLTVAYRSAVRLLLAHARRGGRNLRTLLVVGTNARAAAFAAKVGARPELGYRVLGFVDEDWSGTPEFERSGFRVIAQPQHLVEFLRDNVVDEVVIALPMGSAYRQAQRIIATCEEQGILVRFLSDLFPLKHARATVETFEDEPVVTIWSGTMEGWPLLLKRALDVLLSSSLLLLLSPLLLAIAVAVKATSRGPVFFTQQRIGLHKRRFPVHKFRTMVVDAETRLAEVAHLNEVSGPVFKIRRDPRLTPLGRFLRQTSFDELPQLWDVLAGHMSLVGPRPLPVRDYEGFAHDWHRRRFSVRPGMTCLWQVNGRSFLPFERWMELDMQYIDQWSLWLDLKILLQTIPAVLRGSGAA